ncbi:hypothetical protein M222_0088 [Enterococcus faecalis AZ19]|nr:hypothetical protein HMPREF9505_01400 [Enterococcus faecalis TX0109]EFU01046.1 hypothetical protein HMPREF9503_00432 [Enterococcus faecalis TX0043]EFU07812.1 hypothetical protein HMPREF9516_02607 [Enterococcus faecalis TX1302]KAJ76965.1 hypothetical protein M222_0088 [Enterococcus faecalis AZ19]
MSHTFTPLWLMKKLKNTPPRYTKLNVLLVIDEFEDQKVSFFSI